MINYDSILSAFDGKPTLLQWLKLVKKALDESVLKDITVSQDGANVVFTFNFEDGTSISTPAVTVPKGDKGDTGPIGPQGPAGPKGDKGESGGKLYLHYIIGSVSNSIFNLCLYTSSPEPINSNDKAFNVLNVGDYQNRIIPGYFKGDKKYCCGVIFDKTTGAPAVRVEYLSETGNNVVEEANINNDIVTEL